MKSPRIHDKARSLKHHHSNINKSNKNNKKTRILKETKPSDEEKFLQGFFNEVKELKSDDDDDVYELSKTLHSQSFNRALKEKKIPISYNVKRQHHHPHHHQESVAKKNTIIDKKSSSDQSVSEALPKNLTTAVVVGKKKDDLELPKYVVEGSRRTSNVSVGLVLPKNESTKQSFGKTKKNFDSGVKKDNKMADSKHYSKHSKVEMSVHSNKPVDYEYSNNKKTAIKKELNFLNTLSQEDKGSLNRLAKPRFGETSIKRENISVHNSVKSSAKLGKRYNIQSDTIKMPKHDVGHLQPVMKRENISVHNSVKSSAKLGKRYNIQSETIKMPKHDVGHLQLVMKRENISVHNSVKSSAVLGGGITLGKRSKITQKPLLAESNTKAKILVDQTAGKKMRISSKTQINKASYRSLHQTSTAPVHRNETTTTSLKSHVKYEELKRANLNRAYEFIKRENVSVHNAVQSSAKLDGLRLGKRNKIDGHQTLKLGAKLSNSSIHNSVKPSDKLRTTIPLVGGSDTIALHPVLPAERRQDIHELSSPAIPDLNEAKKKGAIEEYTKQSKASATQVKNQQEHQLDLQEQMEMFNKLTVESKGMDELFYDQPMKKTRRVSPSLKNKDKMNHQISLVNKMQQAKKSVSVQSALNKKVFNSTNLYMKKAKDISGRSEKPSPSNPTIKSTIGPIGHESRMFSTDKIMRRMTNQERVYQTLAKGSNTSPAQRRHIVMNTAVIVGSTKNSTTTSQSPRTIKNAVPTIILNNKNSILDPKSSTGHRENVTREWRRQTSKQVFRAKRQADDGKLQGYNIGEIKRKSFSLVKDKN